MLTHDFKDARLAAIAAEPVTRYPIAHADLVFRGSCAICGVSAFDEAASVYIGRLCVHQTVICKQCTFSWRALSPTDDWFTRMAELQPPYKRPYSAARFAAYRKRAEMVAPYVKHNAHILDVGAASYEGVDAFKEAGYLDVCGVEPMGDGTTIEQLCEERLLDFNLVVMSHVLEHCRDPLAVMRGLKSILKPKGIVYLEVPHAFQIINWSDAFYFAHKCNFTWESMSTLLKAAGYKVLNERSVKFDDADRRDMAFILADGDYGPPYVGDNSGIRAMIKDQYTAGLSIRVESPPQYEIPYVDHFHYGMRFNRWDVHKEGTRIVMTEKAITNDCVL